MRHHGFSRSSLYKVTSEQALRNLLIERYASDQDSEPLPMVLGSITPLTSAKNALLLETARRHGRWCEVAEGSAATLIQVIASESTGTLHGLGFLDARLRRLGTGQARLPVTLHETRTFV